MLLELSWAGTLATPLLLLLLLMLLLLLRFGVLAMSGCQYLATDWIHIPSFQIVEDALVELHDKILGLSMVT